MMCSKIETRTWQHDLPIAFVDLCDLFEIATSDQAWMLALALKRDRSEFPGGLALSHVEIDELLRVLAPAERGLTATPDLPDMPIGGAMNPSTLPNMMQTTRSMPVLPKTDDAPRQSQDVPKSATSDDEQDND